MCYGASRGGGVTGLGALDVRPPEARVRIKGAKSSQVVVCVLRSEQRGGGHRPRSIGMDARSDVLSVWACWLVLAQSTMLRDICLECAGWSTSLTDGTPAF